MLQEQRTGSKQDGRGRGYSRHRACLLVLQMVIGRGKTIPMRRTQIADTRVDGFLFFLSNLQ